MLVLRYRPQIHRWWGAIVALVPVFLVYIRLKEPELLPGGHDGTNIETVG